MDWITPAIRDLKRRLRRLEMNTLRAGSAPPAGAGEWVTFPGHWFDNVFVKPGNEAGDYPPPRYLLRDNQIFFRGTVLYVAPPDGGVGFTANNGQIMFQCAAIPHENPYGCSVPGFIGPPTAATDSRHAGVFTITPDSTVEDPDTVTHCQIRALTEYGLTVGAVYGLQFLDGFFFSYEEWGEVTP